MVPGPILGMELEGEPIRGMGLTVKYSETHSRNGCVLEQEWANRFQKRFALPFEYCIGLRPFTPIRSGMGCNPFKYRVSIPFLCLPAKLVFVTLWLIVVARIHYLAMMKM
jgi:hypothetical protein